MKDIAQTIRKLNDKIDKISEWVKKNKKTSIRIVAYSFITLGSLSLTRSMNLPGIPKIAIFLMFFALGIWVIEKEFLGRKKK